MRTIVIKKFVVEGKTYYIERFDDPESDFVLLSVIRTEDNKKMLGKRVKNDNEHTARYLRTAFECDVKMGLRKG